MPSTSGAPSTKSPWTAAITPITKGLGSLFGFLSNKKKAKTVDAYANTKGQSDVDYFNANTTYGTGIQNQQSRQDENSRTARASLKTSLLRSLGPNIIGQEAMPALERNAVYSPVDYSGAPQRTFTRRPDSFAGGFTGALSSLFNDVAAGSASRDQANDYQDEMEKYRFALQNPGVQRIPTSNVNYSKIFEQVFGRG